MTSLDTYDVLTSSNIEGIDSIAQKYSTIYKSMKKKPYEILDHRKIDFDHDYEDFKRQLAELEVSFPSFFIIFLLLSYHTLLIIIKK